jgi:hypothetical protein
MILVITQSGPSVENAYDRSETRGIGREDRPRARRSLTPTRRRSSLIGGFSTVRLLNHVRGALGVDAVRHSGGFCRRSVSTSGLPSNQDLAVGRVDRPNTRLNEMPVCALCPVQMVAGKENKK